MPIVHQHDEVGQILARLRAVAVGHLETEVVILGVGDHRGMRFGHAAELALPVAVEHDPVDLVLRRRAAGVPAVGARRVEANVRRGARGIVRIEQRLDRPLAEKLARDRRGDLVAGHIRQFLIHQLGGIGVAFADETGVEPLLGDALELAEEVQLRLLAGVAPFGVEQPLRDVEDERGRPHVAQVLQAHVHAFADDAGVARDRGARRDRG